VLMQTPTLPKIVKPFVAQAVFAATQASEYRSGPRNQSARAQRL